MSRMMVRQEIPVEIRLTGNTNRWATGRDGPSEIASVEAEILAKGYDKPVWVNADKVMWEDWQQVSQGELERFCRYEADIRDSVAALEGFATTASHELRSYNHPELLRIVAHTCVEAARHQDIAPTELIGRIEKAGRLGDLLSGVSVHSIINYLWLTEY